MAPGQEVYIYPQRLLGFTVTAWYTMVNYLSNKTKDDCIALSYRLM